LRRRANSPAGAGETGGVDAGEDQQRDDNLAPDVHGTNPPDDRSPCAARPSALALFLAFETQDRRHISIVDPSVAMRRPSFPP
jgi:hypothetical protein